MKRYCSISFLAGDLFLAGSLRGAEAIDEIIAKARAYIGSEEKLGAINAIHYMGTYVDTNRGTTGQIEIYLQKPFRQRLEISEGDEVQTTAIDGYDGWKRQVNRSDPKKWQLVILEAGELKRMRANTFENLNFFRGIEKVRGTVENKGVVKSNGRDAHRLIFQYGVGLFYERLIDVNNGELLLTVNDQGLEIKEVGEIFVDGIRFPEKVITLVNGEIINTVSFHSIKLNEDLEASIFELPSFLVDSGDK